MNPVPPLISNSQSDIANGGADFYSRKGDWMLEFRVISDSAYKKAWEDFHPKIATLEGFPPPESSESFILMYGWIRTKSGSGKWMDIHGKVDWPEPDKLLRSDDFGVTVYCRRLDFSDVLDQSSLRKVLQKLTSDLRKKIGLNLSVRQHPG